MDAARTKMRRCHHRTKRRFDRAARIGEEVGDAGEGLVWLGVEHVENRADQERMAGFLPMVPPLQGSFRIDQHIGDILDVANLPLSATDFQQRVVGSAGGVGGIEQ